MRVLFGGAAFPCVNHVTKGAVFFLVATSVEQSGQNMQDAERPEKAERIKIEDCSREKPNKPETLSSKLSTRVHASHDSPGIGAHRRQNSTRKKSSNEARNSPSQKESRHRSSRLLGRHSRSRGNGSRSWCRGRGHDNGHGSGGRSSRC